MIRTIFQCDECKAEIEKFVVFEATENNLKQTPIYCRDCAVNRLLPEWIDAKLSNGCNAVLVSAGVTKVGRPRWFHRILTTASTSMPPTSFGTKHVNS